MNQTITIKQLESIRIAYIQYQGIASQANKIFPKVFQAIRGKSNGAPFFEYQSLDLQTKFADMELCVPTAEKPSNQYISIKQSSSYQALCLTHIGSYETLSHSYKRLETYAKEHHLILQFPFREIFIKGPGLIIKGNPHKYITEICCAFQENQHVCD